MAISAWQPSTLYLPGTIVVPTAVPGAVATAIPNADFEGGDVDWLKDAGWAINTNLAFSGTYSAEYAGPGVGSLISGTKHPVAPGKAITASCFVHQGASDDGQASAAVVLRWYDDGDVFISDSAGNSVTTGAVGIWQKSTVSGVAPANAAKVAIGVSANNDWAVLNVDNFSWNYVTGAAATGLAYKAIGATTGPRTDIAFVDSNPDTITRVSGSFLADGFKDNDTITISGGGVNLGVETVTTVTANTITLTAEVTAQAAGPTITIEVSGSAGTSGASEPIWPLNVGDTVADNDITWVAVETDSVTWEATSILTSGSSEPTWPELAGAYISDNNIAWETVPLRIEDENCPHTKVVAIAASKVFAGDTDIVRFCATLNARDWSSEDDAGFLPTGLQQKSQVGVDAMGVYRGNLAVWSASTFQVWQVDPDPAVMALLDAMEGIGSIHQQAVQPVSDDLFFLASLGVRTVSIAEGSNNLASGDVGVPIDILVQAEVNQLDVEPVASYYPSGGQYWLAFRPLTIAAALLAGQFLITSPPYPIEEVDSLEIKVTPVGGRMIRPTWTDSLVHTVTPQDGAKPFGIDYYDRTIESLAITVTPKRGDKPSEIVVHDSWEDAITHTVTPQDGTKASGLITHDQPTEEEDIICTVTPQDGYKVI